MQDHSKMAGKIKAQITRFAHRMALGFKRPDKKFICQMLYGIQASKDVKLSNIVRALGEDIALIKTEARLSRNVGKEDWTDIINRRLAEQGACRIGNDTVLALDIGDIDKPYAKAMEHLAQVRDGSTGELRSNGYWTMQVLAADVEGEELVPLYGELYSQKASNFVSENHQILKAIDTVGAVLGRRGIWVIDRGADRSRIYQGMLDRHIRFVIRMTGKRHLLFQGQPISALAITHKTACHVEREVIIQREGKTQKKKITLGYEAVQLPGRPESLYLVVIKGFGEKPMMLLTNLSAHQIGADRLLEIYLTRWKCEESYRFIKQSYNLEDIRLLTYTGLRNMVALVQAVFYFVSVELGKKLKLNILLKKVLERSKRFFEIPDFKQYAIADGIHRILFSYRAQKDYKILKSNQLLFPFACIT
jgi:hypothetical protein